MCTSQEAGGTRCAAHTRPAYVALMAEIAAAGDGFGAAAHRKTIRSKFQFDGQNALNIISNYASTRSGLKHVMEDREIYKHDTALAAVLNTCAAKGKNRNAAAKEISTTIRKEKAREEGKAKGWASKMVAHDDLPLADSALGACPQINGLWHPEDNDGIGPHQVKRQANCNLVWRCKPAGHVNEGRVNNAVNVMNNGGRMICKECQPRRAAQLQATQEELGALLEALGDDPDAFASLSPALQYSLLAKMGFMSAAEGSMQRSLALNIVHGDLTLKEVMAAQDLEKLDRKMKDLGDDDETLGAVSDIDINDMVDTEVSPRKKVQQVMASAGAMGLVDPDSELAGHILRENLEELWSQAYEDPDNLDGLSATVQGMRNKSAGAAIVADRFVADLQRVRSKELPDGYQTDRLNPDGTIQVMDPTLSQRRFAALVEERRRVMNWSGTGAGKTLAATLAVQGAGAKETLVVCPNAVVNQWEEAFKSGFPDNTEVRVGLPTGNEAPPADGMNRVWVVNYDKFQTDPEGLADRLAPLAGNVDAVVFDEIHKAKKSDANASSRRRSVLENFTDKAGAANPDLVVIGASATPVVNNLEEAASVLRLVEGPESRRFPTAPTMKNAAAAHHRIAESGIRHMPTYPTTMTREDVTVDVSSALPRINARVNAMKEKSPTGALHPAMMERALLPEKLPAIVAAVKKSTSPSVVYTEYTAGMVSPMDEAFKAEGLRVRHYTGEQSADERAASLKAFKNGEVDVMIGSKPIGTGVDGLQNVCNNAVVASMSWTAADDDQFVGRFQRRGQQNNVNITYVLSEATVGKARWSWCKDNRQKRVKYKRSLADAAVDGVMPDGVLESQDAGMEHSMSALQRML